MLILTRNVDQSILIYTPAGVIKIMVTAIQMEDDGRALARPRVKFGIDAPAEYLILKDELADRDRPASGKPESHKGAA